MGTTIIAIGLAVLFAVALYGVLTGKVKGPRCGCGTGACGRPADDETLRGADFRRPADRGDERLSAENPPSDEELSDDNEK